MLLRRDRAMTAIAVILDIAFHAGRGDAVTGAAEVADRLAAQRRGIEPVFQALSRAGLLDSLRGPRGGYRLGRRPRDIRLAEVIAAVTEEAAPGTDPGGRLQAAVVAPLWRDMEARLAEGLEALTVEDLLKRAQAAGLKRPSAEPLNFAI